MLIRFNLLVRSSVVVGRHPGASFRFAVAVAWRLLLFVTFTLRALPPSQLTHLSVSIFISSRLVALEDSLQSRLLGAAFMLLCICGVALLRPLALPYSCSHTHTLPALLTPCTAQ